MDAAKSYGVHTAWGTSPGDAYAFGQDGGSGGPAPCVVNGDIWTRDDARVWRQRTGARGAMSARGLLANPVRISPADTALANLHRHFLLAIPIRPRRP